MKKVDLQKILTKHIGEYAKSPVSPNVLEAMQEACNQTVDLCAENAHTKVEMKVVELEMKFNDVIDKQSILDTKKQII